MSLKQWMIGSVLVKAANGRQSFHHGGMLLTQRKCTRGFGWPEAFHDGNEPSL
jgi:hypothetical protein